MYARVISSQGPVGQVDQIERYLQDQLIPSVKGTSGFVAGYWLGDRRTGKGLTITVWESEAALQASGPQANPSMMQQLQALGITLTGVEQYEVLGQA
jgi:hypothetical protein